MKFTDFKLSKNILSAIEHKGYIYPTPIQEQSIPPILAGRDLIGIAQTGTGKTAAFAIPMIQNIIDRPYKPGIKALILTPTRELAIQIEENLKAYGKNTKIRHLVIFGGVSQHHQVRKLKAGVDILVATPGRLLDLVKQRHIDLSMIQIFTLDEADRMLDMGFIHDIKKVLKVIPKKRQTLFFSATMPTEIQKLTQTILKNPVKVEIAAVSSTAETVEQKLYLVDKGNKRQLLVHILKDPEIPSALVFTRTKHGADKLVKFMEQQGIRSKAIHGNKSQNARQNALREFKAKQIKVLVATDIASRGIDVKELSHVINFEIPNEPETYVHRIGRTGRAQNTGLAMSFCDHEEKAHINSIQKLIKKEIPREDRHPFPMIKNPATLEAHRGSKPKPKRHKQRGRKRHF